MKAMYCKEYGSLENLSIAEVDTPKPGDNEVLVRVAATSVNFNTIAHVTGKPIIARSYPLHQSVEALKHCATGKAQGKVVITVED